MAIEIKMMPGLNHTVDLIRMTDGARGGRRMASPLGLMGFFQALAMTFCYSMSK
jgi:hypothetical protein